MNAWDRIEEVERNKSFTKVIQSPMETFMDFLQRLTLAVNRMIPNSEAGQTIIEYLAFKNTNPQCQRIIRPLNARSALLEAWIQDKSILDLMTIMILGEER